MRDESARAFEELSIFVAEGVHLLALGIKHSKNLMMLIDHRDNDLGARCVKGGQITRIVPYIAHNNGFARFQRRPAYALTDGKPRISGRVLTRFRLNHELRLHNLINTDP